MIKQGLKNYFKNLKYIFNPLGAIALGFVFGMSILISVIISSTNGLINDIKIIVSNANLDFNALKDSFLSIVKALDWSEPLETFKLMVSQDWLLETLATCLSSFIGGVDTYTVPLTNAISKFSANIICGFAGLLIFVILGAIGGYFLVKCLVRRNIAKRTFKKYLLSNIIDSVFSILIIFVCVWLYTLWKYSIFITIFFAFIFFGIFALLQAYLVHSRKVLNIKEIVNIKNVLKLLLTNLLILLISASIIGILILITNLYVGIFVGLALTQIAFVVIGLNAESYVIELVKSKEFILV